MGVFWVYHGCVMGVWCVWWVCDGCVMGVMMDGGAWRLGRTGRRSRLFYAASEPKHAKASTTSSRSASRHGIAKSTPSMMVHKTGALQTCPATSARKASVSSAPASTGYPDKRKASKPNNGRSTVATIGLSKPVATARRTRAATRRIRATECWRALRHPAHKTHQRVPIKLALRHQTRRHHLSKASR